MTAGAFQLGSAVNGDGDQPLHISRIEFSSVADFSDDRRLVGFAEDVFLRQVAGVPVRSVAHQGELRGRFTEANRSPVPFRFDG